MAIVLCVYETTIAVGIFVGGAMSLLSRMRQFLTDVYRAYRSRDFTRGKYSLIQLKA